MLALHFARCQLNSMVCALFRLVFRKHLNRYRLKPKLDTGWAGFVSFCVYLFFFLSCLSIRSAYFHITNCFSADFHGIFNRSTGEKGKQKKLRSLNCLLCVNPVGTSMWLSSNTLELVHSQGLIRKWFGAAFFLPLLSCFFFSISSTIWFELNTSSTLLSLLPSSWPPCIEHQIGYTWLLMQFILLKLYWMESISQTYSHMQWKHYSQQQNMVFTPNFTLFGPNNAHGSKNIHRIVNRRISNNFHWVEMTGKRRE